MKEISKEDVNGVLDWVYKARKMILAIIVLTIYGNVVIRALTLMDPALIVNKVGEIAMVVVAFYFLTSKAGDSERRLLEAYGGAPLLPYESVVGELIPAEKVAPAPQEIERATVAETREAGRG